MPDCDGSGLGTSFVQGRSADRGLQFMSGDKVHGLTGLLI